MQQKTGAGGGFVPKQMGLQQQQQFQFGAGQRQITPGMYSGGGAAGQLGGTWAAGRAGMASAGANNKKEELTEEQRREISAAEKEAEQKRLEEEMRKRRERIEKWRNEKKAKDALTQMQKQQAALPEKVS